MEQLLLLCCPVLKPQIVGDPLFPGDEILNESVTQSPMPEPKIERRRKTQIKWIFRPGLT